MDFETKTMHNDLHKRLKTYEDVICEHDRFKKAYEGYCIDRNEKNKEIRISNQKRFQALQRERSMQCGKWKKLTQDEQLCHHKQTEQIYAREKIPVTHPESFVDYMRNCANDLFKNYSVQAWCDFLRERDRLLWYVKLNGIIEQNKTDSCELKLSKEEMLQITTIKKTLEIFKQLGYNAEIEYSYYEEMIMARYDGSECYCVCYQGDQYDETSEHYGEKPDDSGHYSDCYAKDYERIETIWTAIVKINKI